MWFAERQCQPNSRRWRSRDESATCRLWVRSQHTVLHNGPTVGPMSIFMLLFKGARPSLFAVCNLSLSLPPRHLSIYGQIRSIYGFPVVYAWYDTISLNKQVFSFFSLPRLGPLHTGKWSSLEVVTRTSWNQDHRRLRGREVDSSPPFICWFIDIELDQRVKMVLFFSVRV